MIIVGSDANGVDQLTGTIQSHTHVAGAARLAPRPAIFVMRDRLICEEQLGCVLSTTAPRLAFGAIEGLRILARVEAPIVMLMDQAHVSHSLAVQQAMELRQGLLVDEIVAQGGRCDGVFACPHWPDEACDCHAPQPALLLEAAQSLNLDLSRSALICDTWDQAYAALTVRCQPIMTMTACGRAEMALPMWAELRARAWYAADLVGAALCVEATVSGQRLWQSLQPAQLAHAG